MVFTTASARFNGELELFRRAWCSIPEEPAHYNADSWAQLRQNREQAWEGITDWCIGNSITVDQSTIAIARQVLHHLVEAALQARINEEIGNRPGTSVGHFANHVNDAFNTTTAPWTTFEQNERTCSTCMFSRNINMAPACILSQHQIPDEQGVPLIDTHGCASWYDRDIETGFSYSTTSGRLDHEYFVAHGFRGDELTQVYRVLNFLLTRLDCEGQPFIRYTENRNSSGQASRPEGADDLRADMEGNHRSVTILGVDRWERYLEERYGRRQTYNANPQFSRQRSDWYASQGNLLVDVHLILGEFAGRLIAGEGWGFNQYRIRDGLHGCRDVDNLVQTEQFYNAFDNEGAGHMAETFIGRRSSDQNAAVYNVVHGGEVNEAIELDPGHLRHHARLQEYAHHHGGEGGGE